MTRDHYTDIVACLANLFGLSSEAASIRFQDFFIGYNNPNYGDFVTVKFADLVKKKEEKPDVKLANSIDQGKMSPKRALPPAEETSAPVPKKPKIKVRITICIFVLIESCPL